MFIDVQNFGCSPSSPISQDLFYSPITYIHTCSFLILHFSLHGCHLYHTWASSSAYELLRQLSTSFLFSFKSSSFLGFHELLLQLSDELLLQLSNELLLQLSKESFFSFQTSFLFSFHSSSFQLSVKLLLQLSNEPHQLFIYLITSSSASPYHIIFLSFTIYLTNWQHSEE